MIRSEPCLMFDEDEWDLYLVNMQDLTTGEEVGKMWPVYATNYDHAISIYQLMLMICEDNSERSEYS
jgi:hypothetical protein